MIMVACQQVAPSTSDVQRRPSEMSSAEFVGTSSAALIQDEMTCSPNYTSSDFGPVNLTTAGTQFAPSVAGLVGEKAIFVWEAYEQTIGYDGETPIKDEDFGIFARVVNRDGTTFWPASGFDFHINSAGAEDGAQTYPDVSARANASTARISIVWMSDNEWGGSTGKDVVASVWTWSDTTQTLSRNAIFNPTTTTSGNQNTPTVTHLWNVSEHVVVWENVGNGNIYLSLCDNAGSCSPTEQQVNTSGFINCAEARVDGFRSEENGGFVVVMVCEDENENLRHVYYRRYDDDAVAVDTTLQLVSHNEGSDDVHRPDVACLDNDDFIVVWESGVYANEAINIRRRHMEYDGTDVAQDQQVNTDSPSYGSWQPRVSAYEGGDKYAVVWEDKLSQSDLEVFYRRYTSSSGSAIDSTQQDLSATTSGMQARPAVDVMKCGYFVAGWITTHVNSTTDIFGAFKN